jgi:hypothetical protein
MEQAKTGFAAALCVALFGFGCSKSGSNAERSAAARVGPDHVIGEFLEAVRTGDDTKAAQLLTPLAQKKTSEMEMVVAPPGSDTARFNVLDVKFVKDGAHVTSDWTDLDTDGRPHTDRIVWMLRQGTEGWRIAGMATRVFEDQEPIVLNFEDPADMLVKQQRAEEEIARRIQQGERQAENSSEESAGAIR